MAEAVAGHLVWVKGLKGPRPEKWPPHPIDAVTNGKTVLAKHPLNAEQFSLSLLILEQRYPAPQLAEDAP